MYPKYSFIVHDASGRTVAENLGDRNLSFWQSLKLKTRKSYNQAPDIIHRSKELFNNNYVTEEEYRRELEELNKNLHPASKITVKYHDHLTKERMRSLHSKQLRINEIDRRLGQQEDSSFTSDIIGAVIGHSVTPLGALEIAAGAAAAPFTGGASFGAVMLRSMAVSAGIEAAVQPLYAQNINMIEGGEFGYLDAATNIFAAGFATGAFLGIGKIGSNIINSAKYKINSYKKKHFFPASDRLVEKFNSNTACVNENTKLMLEISSHIDDITSLNKIDIQKLIKQEEKLYTKLGGKYPEIFNKKENFALLKEKIFNDFSTSNIDNIPASLKAKLKDFDKKLSSSIQLLKEDKNFTDIAAKIKDINQQKLNYFVSSRIKENIYNIDPVKFARAKEQFLAGEKIDVNAPLSKKYEDLTYKEEFNIDKDIRNLQDKLQIKLQEEADLSTLQKKAKHSSLKEQEITTQRLKDVNAFKHSPEDGMSNLFKNADLHIHQTKRQVEAFFTSKMDYLMEALENPHYSMDIARAIWNKSHNIKYNVTSKTSQKAANIISEIMDYLKDRGKRAGLHINELQGFIASQSHDRKLLEKVTPGKWVEDVTQLLSPKSKYSEDELKKMYQNIVSEHHGELSRKSKGAYNIANRLNHGRKLHFKDPDSFVKYLNQYGRYDFAGTIIKTIDKLAGNIAIAEYLSTNPKKLINNIFNKIIDNLKINNKLSQARKFVGNSKKYETLLDMLMGYNYAGDQSVAAEAIKKILPGYRALKTYANLGGVVISSIPDLGLVLKVVHQQGAGLFKEISRITNMLTPSKGNITKEACIEAAKLAGVFVSSFHDNITAKIFAHQASSRFFGKANKIYGKLTLIEYWDSALKAATASSLSSNLANCSHIEFNKISKYLRNSLARYGVDAANFSRIKKLIYKADDGNLYLNLNSSKESELCAALRRYILDLTDTAVVTPHLMDKYYMSLGGSTGLWGEICKSLLQFKSYSLNFVTRSLSYMTKGKLHPSEIGKKMPKPGSDFIAFVTAMTALGVLSYQLKSIVKGRGVPPLFDGNTLYQGALQGGALGFVTDLALEAPDQYGYVLPGVARPPLAGDIVNMFRIIHSAGKGDIDKAKTITKRTIKGMIPGQNLFYLRAAGNAIFEEHLQK